MSTESKMFASFPSTYQPELRRRIWGRLFGLGIRECREHVVLSVEEAARLAGMEISEWDAIEEGHVPQETSWLRPMAAALEISFGRIMNMVLLCRDAWEL
ncbi:MAG: helix-turn-helix domain-containing protein [Bryobacteraceae bacterium]|nr:helix-turn-helix domain-containing protein [Bryobacteraceae bacterium]